MQQTQPAPDTYPASYSVDYPEQPRNRLTVFFRIFTAIPIWIVIALLIGGSQAWRSDNVTYMVYGSGLVVIPTVLMLLFRKKYPKWWFDWNLNLTKFATRVTSYIALLRDEYPSTDEEQAVHVDIPYPDAQKLSRGLPLIKWFLAIPHFIVLAFIAIGVFVVSIIAWFAILFTARYPKGLFDFVVGYHRWVLRVDAYAILLTTDKYPPFRLSP